MPPVTPITHYKAVLTLQFSSKTCKSQTCYTSTILLTLNTIIYETIKVQWCSVEVINTPPPKYWSTCPVANMLQFNLVSRRSYRETRLSTYETRKNKYWKGKSVPLQAWSGPEGSRKLRFPDFMTTAQDGGKVVSLTHRLQPAKRAPPKTSRTKSPTHNELRTRRPMW